MASARATIDHDEIRQWVEERGGHPAHVKRSGGDGDPGILRIDDPGFSGQVTLEKISWKEFFEAFDANNLAFLFQDDSDSRFSKLVDRSTVELSGGRARQRTSTKRAPAKKAASKKRSSSSSTKRAAGSRHT